jgi:hypothetical protein
MITITINYTQHNLGKVYHGTAMTAIVAQLAKDWLHRQNNDHNNFIKTFVMLIYIFKVYCETSNSPVIAP